MGIPIQAAIQTKELLHLTGAIHQAIRDLDKLVDRQTYLTEVLGVSNDSELIRQLQLIRTDLNSSLVQIYGF